MENNKVQSLKKLNVSLSRFINTVIEHDKSIQVIYNIDYTKIIYKGSFAGNRFWIIENEADLDMFRHDIKYILKYETN
jgi:hypothetical protein